MDLFKKVESKLKKFKKDDSLNSNAIKELLIKKKSKKLDTLPRLDKSSPSLGQESVESDSLE